jgi:hypothetical protein
MLSTLITSDLREGPKSKTSIERRRNMTVAGFILSVIPAQDARLFLELNAHVAPTT